MKEKELKDILRRDFNFVENWKPLFAMLFNKVQYFSNPSNPFSEDKKVIDGKQTGLIKLDDGRRFLQAWATDAKIEHVIEAWKVHNPRMKFRVFSVNVGSFEIKEIDHSLSNGRGVDQDMNVVIDS